MRSKQRKYRILSFLAYLASTESIVHFRGKWIFELLPPQKISAVRRRADTIPPQFRLHLRPLNFKESDEIFRTNISMKTKRYLKQCYCRKAERSEMIRNVCRNTAIASRDNPSLAPNISEYKIGHTTYIVETHFNLGCKETLDDIIKRLILRDVEGLQFAA